MRARVRVFGRPPPEIPPLDMSCFLPNDATSDNSIGVIQTPSQFHGLALTLTDRNLGVPSLRNTSTALVVIDIVQKRY